jgi:hypothetical protein
VSDRRSWLEVWCPTCSAAPGSRCRRRGRGRRRIPSPRIHAARGWRERRCPTCKSGPEEPCRTPSGRESSRPHIARLYPSPAEFARREQVWEQLERRGAQIAVVSFSGRGGQGGRVHEVTLSRSIDGRALEERLWESNELACGLAAPIWDRYGTFVGHSAVRGIATWSVEDRLVVISGERGRERFEEIVE